MFQLLLGHDIVALSSDSGFKQTIGNGVMHSNGLVGGNGPRRRRPNAQKGQGEQYVIGALEIDYTYRQINAYMHTDRQTDRYMFIKY